MSQRTIVEFNHDMVREMIRLGVNEHDNQTRRRLNRYGIKTRPTHHHSDIVEITIGVSWGTYWTQKF